MKRAALAVPIAALLVAVAWPVAHGGRAEGGVCALMTPARMLENPGLAQEYAEALRSGEASELARVEAILRHIRAVHGCEGEVALPAAPTLPPGHPPIDGGRRTPARAPSFEAPGIVTI